MSGRNPFGSSAPGGGGGGNSFNDPSGGQDEDPESQYPDPTNTSRLNQPYFNNQGQRPQLGGFGGQLGIGSNQPTSSPNLYVNPANLTTPAAPQQPQYGLPPRAAPQYGSGAGNPYESSFGTGNPSQSGFGTGNPSQYGTGAGQPSPYDWGPTDLQQYQPPIRRRSPPYRSPYANNDDEQYQQYRQTLDNEWDARSRATSQPQGFGLGQGLGQPQGPQLSMQLRPRRRGPAGGQGGDASEPSFGPGIDGQRVPTHLAHFYNMIPARLRTREYWMNLVQSAENNAGLNSQQWINMTIQRLADPSTNVQELLGFVDLSQEWRNFLMDSSVFFSNSITPEVWANMIKHLYTCTPGEWYGHVSGILARRASGEEPNAPLTMFTPPTAGFGRFRSAAQPPQNYEGWDMTKKPFTGRWDQHPEFWGDFVDDGPRRPNETPSQTERRIRWSRSNMGIERRPRPGLPQIAPVTDPGRRAQILEERRIHSQALRRENDANLRKHNRMMDESNRNFNTAYRDDWRKKQKERRARNAQRRDEAYNWRAFFYRQINRPVPPKPEPPEDSDDDFLFDVDPPRRPKADAAEEDYSGGEEEQEEGEKGRNREPYRCSQCAKDRKPCSYRNKRFPCDRCVTIGEQDSCSSSKPGKARSGKKKNDPPPHRLRGPFIPSFVTPPRPEDLPEHVPFDPQRRGQPSIDDPSTRVGTKRKSPGEDYDEDYDEEMEDAQPSMNMMYPPARAQAREQRDFMGTYSNRPTGGFTAGPTGFNIGSSPYEFITEDLNDLYESRRVLGGLSYVVPLDFADLEEALQRQDSRLLELDPSYERILTVRDAEAYAAAVALRNAAGAILNTTEEEPPQATDPETGVPQQTTADPMELDMPSPHADLTAILEGTRMPDTEQQNQDWPGMPLWQQHTADQELQNANDAFRAGPMSQYESPAQDPNDVNDVPFNWEDTDFDDYLNYANSNAS